MLTHDQVVEIAKKYPIESYRVGGEPKYNPWLFDFARDIERASAAPAEGRECCNENCRWVGPASETVQMKHGAPNNLCPECHEVTESIAPTQPAEGREAFEEFAKERMLDVQPSVLGGDYVSFITNLVWAGWKGHAALATAPTMSEAARDVLAERRRQIEQEGWTLKHDDEHDGGQLPMAAASYAVAASYASAGLFPMPKGAPPTSWPWRKSWWKPTTPRRDLVKAGALILAELERIDRAAAKEKKRA